MPSSDNVPELVAEFVRLNARLKSGPVGDQEKARWLELKEALREAMAAESGAADRPRAKR